MRCNFCEFCIIIIWRNDMVIISAPDSGLSAVYSNVVIGSSTAIDVAVTIGSSIVLSEAYLSNSSRNILIKGLGEFAMNYFDRNDFVSSNGLDGSAVAMALKVESGSEPQLNRTITIYPCLINFWGSLTVASLKQIALSRVSKKQTGIGRSEYLSFYGGGGSVTAFVQYRSGSSVVSGTFSLYSLPSDGKSFYHVNVSPSVVANLAGCSEVSLIYYDVYKAVGSKFRFRMSERNYPFQKTFVFRNCFGAMESFTCVGEEVSDRKWEREFGVVGHKNVQVRRELESVFRISTGYLSAGEIDVVEDLLNSEQVRLVDGNMFREVVIVEEEFDITSRKDEVNAVEFSYKLIDTVEVFPPVVAGSVRNHKFKKEFLFKNSVGLFESFSCVGEVVSKRKWSREFGMTGAKEVQVSRELENVFEISTGYLSRAEIGVVVAMLDSEEIKVIDKTGTHEVVIVDEDFSTTSRKDEVNAVVFSYKYADLTLKSTYD